MMVEIQAAADRASKELRDISCAIANASVAFFRIAEIARSMDEANWKESAREIIELAKENE